MNKKVFVIDGANFSTLDGFYDEVSRALIQMEGFGRNLDAFNDILSGGCGKFEIGEKIVLKWRNSGKSRIDLGYPEIISYLKNRIKEHPDRVGFQKELLLAEKMAGQTLFEQLISLFKLHENIDLILE